MGASLWDDSVCGEGIRGIGAVYAVSKARGKTFTLPLEIDALYMAGSADSITQAFAVSSLLVGMALIMLILKNIVEYRGKRNDR